MTEKGEILYNSKNSVEWKRHSLIYYGLSILFTVFFMIMFLIWLIIPRPNKYITDILVLILFLASAIIMATYIPYETINRKPLIIGNNYLYIPKSKKGYKVDLNQLKKVYYFIKRRVLVIILKNGYLEIIPDENYGNPDKILSVLANNLNINVEKKDTKIPLGLINNEKSLLSEIKKYYDIKNGLKKPSLFDRILYNI